MPRRIAGVWPGVWLGAWLWLAVAGWAVAQAPAPPNAALLARIKQRMAANLERAPNYTCLETIERSQLLVSPPMEVSDAVRLEVALVDGKELFSWPGAGRFEEKSIGEMVGGGTTTSGDFAIHARTIFLSGAPTFQYAGEELRRGRPAVRYDYRVSRLLSGYRMKIGEKNGIVAQRGSFWADRETLDLIRLEVYAEEIPSDLEVSTAVTELEYANVRVGSSDFLLPRSVDFLLKHTSGAESHNRTEFTRCRQYVGEASVSFEDTSERPQAAEKQVGRMELDPGLSFEIQLKTPIDSRKAAVGDPITATLQEPVKEEGKRLVPKGAVLNGRIRRLERHKGKVDFFLVGLELDGLEFGDRQARFFGVMEQIGPKPSSVESRGVYGRYGRGVSAPQAAFANIVQDAPGIGAFVVKGDRLRLPAGLRMRWVTAPADTEPPSP